jgi:superfamily II DNA or RNA helicase
MKEIKLFDYQQEMLENITEVFSAAAFDTVLYNEKGKKVNVGSSVMVQMPTGTGKTYVMAAVVKWFLDTYSKGEVWLIAHRKELVEQMERTLDRFALEYGEKDEELKAKVRIRVLSIQWLTRNIGDLEKNGFKPGMIIVDEAHHALATSYQDMFIRNPKALKIGMTATPCRMKQASFRTLFSRLITSPSIKDFILHGYLAPCNYVVIGEKSTEQQIVNLLTDRSGDGDYSVKEMEEKLNVTDVIRRLYNSVVKYAYGKKGIVYAINIDHAKAIAEYYNALGIKAVALDSKTAAKTRKKAVEAFREGELDCLVNVNLFDEGFDCPDVEYIQMARPTLSLAKYLQMVERGLRINKKDPKKVCMIIDNVGNYRKFGLPDRYRDWNAMFEGMMSGRCEVSSYKAEGDGTAETIML